jgi:hypothetical protein
VKKSKLREDFLTLLYLIETEVPEAEGLVAYSVASLLADTRVAASVTKDATAARRAAITLPDIEFATEWAKNLIRDSPVEQAALNELLPRLRAAFPGCPMRVSVSTPSPEEGCLVCERINPVIRIRCAGVNFADVIEPIDDWWEETFLDKSNILVLQDFT